MSVASQAAAANTPVSLNVTDLTTISITSITARRPPASYAQSNCPKCAASWRISKSSATGSISGSLCPWKGPKSCGRNRLNKPLKSVSARFQLGLPKKVKCTRALAAFAYGIGSDQKSSYDGALVPIQIGMGRYTIGAVSRIAERKGKVSVRKVSVNGIDIFQCEPEDATWLAFYRWSIQE